VMTKHLVRRFTDAHTWLRCEAKAMEIWLPIKTGLAESNLYIVGYYIGSGLSFHNMKEFRSIQENDSKNEAFETWLIDTCTSQATNTKQKENALAQWHNAPFARYCDPVNNSVYLPWLNIIR
jgi:hypothetical protein